MADESKVPEIKATEIANKTLDNLAADPKVNLSTASAETIKGAVIKETAAVIMNQTNQEPWYTSRVTWGAVMAVGAGVAGIAGYDFSADDQTFWLENIASIGAILGGIIAWYGRWRAKKAIGK